MTPRALDYWDARLCDPANVERLARIATAARKDERRHARALRYEAARYAVGIARDAEAQVKAAASIIARHNRETMK